MNQKSFAAVTAMINGFPQSTADIRALLLTYDQALSAVSDPAISEAVTRFICGDVQGQSKTFAPSVAEFVQEARKQQDIIDTISRRRIAPPSHVPTGGLAPFQIARQKALTKFQDCPVIAENVGHIEFMAMSKARQIPVGGGWCAQTATVYGPPFEEISLGKRRTAA